MSKTLYNPVDYTFAAETQGKKKKKLDNLTKCALAAQAAGMTYGKYMAQVHPPSRADGSGDEYDEAAEAPNPGKRRLEKCLFNPEVRCPDTTKCASCGWDPMVAARRKREIRKRLRTADHDESKRKAAPEGAAGEISQAADGGHPGGL